MAVVKQYSPVLELIASEWPQCNVVEVPTTCSLRNEIQQILELQKSYTHVAASPQMRARGAALVKSRDQLNWELRTLNKPTTWKSECSNGQGNASDDYVGLNTGSGSNSNNDSNMSGKLNIMLKMK